MSERGRPSSFAPEIAREICRRLAEGESLREVCRGNDMPAESTVRLWAVSDRDGFYAQYARAREAQLERWAEEIVEIADDASNDWIDRQNKDGSLVRVLDREHVTRSGLRVDTRKWLMSKLAPKKYGDKVHLAGDPENPVRQVLAIERRIIDSHDPDSSGSASAT